MPTYEISTSPVIVRMITEDTPRGTRVDEFGETVDFYRLRYVYLYNPTTYTWQLAVTKDGETWTVDLPPNTDTTYNVPPGRRIDYHSFTLSVSRR